MAHIRSVKKVYWHVLKYPVKPKVFVEPAETQEIDGDYRRGRGFAIRIPLTKYALVVGLWLSSHEEGEALTYAISGRIMGDDEINWDMVRFGEVES